MLSYELIFVVEQHVRNILSQEPIKKRPFHNLNHTIQVVQKCYELAAYYNVSDADLEALLISAWFHDTGYSKTNTDHEEESVNMAMEFLIPFNIGQDYLSRIARLILSTKLPSTPVSLIEKILCDSDLHHLGSPDYETWSILLQSEMKLVYGLEYSNEEWRKKNISFLTAQNYFTEYAREKWDNQKQKNLIALST
jgi:predicted metal-dependent HD superfamily phosphohydrolase